MTIEAWKWVAEKLGIPTFFALIFCFAIWRTGVWTAAHVFDPLVTKHIEFLAAEQDSMRSIAKDVGQQASEMRTQTVVLREMRDDQRKFPAVASQMP